MARTFEVKKEITEKPEESVKTQETARYSPDFMRIMSELEEITSGYISMVHAAQKANTSLSRLDSAREDLECYEKKLDELCTPIRALANRSERSVANTRLTCIYNAVCSSLNSILRFS